MDLTRLAKLSTAVGPFISAYLTTFHDVENGAVTRKTAWDNVVRTLTESGVDESTITVLADSALTHPPQGGTRVVIASHGHVHLATWLTTPPPGGDEVTVGELPRLIPLIAARSDRVPHVVVLTDRLGADVYAFTDGDRPVEEASTGDVAPWPVHKTGTGGWAAKRFDASVEESWERSAEQVSTLVEKVARDVNAGLVIGCGDERALSLLREHLPQNLADGFVAIPGGGRHADGGDDRVAQRVEEVTLEYAARKHTEIAERFSEAMGRGEGARAGLDPVIEALQIGEVDTLLLTEEAWSADRDLGFGPDPQQLARSAQDLAAIGISDVRTAPLADVLVRAAVGIAAEVRVLSRESPYAPREGVGAVLRYDVTAPTPPQEV